MNSIYFGLLLWSNFQYISASVHPQSPCPGVFSYEGSEPENDHWYGVILVSTDESLVGVRLDIRFDRPAQLLVSWMGEVTSTNNERFTILSLSQKLLPGPPLSSRFMVKYDARLGSPQLRSIRLNGRQICPPDPNFPISLSNIRYQTTEKSTKRPDPAFNINHYNSPEMIDSHHHHQNPPLQTTTASSYAYNGGPSGNVQNTNANNHGYGYDGNFPKEMEDGRPYKRPVTVNNGEKNYENTYNNNNPVYPNNGIGNNYNYEQTTQRKSINTKRTQDITTTSSTTERYIYKDPQKTAYNSNRDSSTETSNRKPSTSNTGTSYNNRSNTDSYDNGNKGNSNYNSNKKQPNQSQSPSNGNTNNIGSKSNYSTQRTTTSTSSTTERYVKRTTQSTPHYNNDSYNVKYENNNNNNQQKENNPPKHHASSSKHNMSNANNLECGVVDKEITGGNPAPAPLITNGQNTARGQWPWHIALYKIDRINLSYVCGGTLVTSSAVITAAHCVTKKLLDRPVDPDTLVVYLGKYHLLQFSDDEGVQNKQVKDVHVYPKYNSTNYTGDIAVLMLSSPAEYTSYVRPCCLWRNTRETVIGKEGTVVGWGFDENNHVTEELKMAKMPVVSQETCVWSYPEFFMRFTSDKTYCAGFRTGTTVCNGDSGGGMVFNQDSKWHLRGLVSITVAREGLRVCDTNHYVVFTDILKYIDWIDQYI